MRLLLARVLGVALALALAPLGGAACRRSPAIATEVDAGVTALDARHEPLRARFDALADSPRLLVLASPT